MAKEDFEIFIHAQGAKPKVALVTDEDVLLDVLVRADALTENNKDVLVFVGEEENESDNDDEDQQSPIDARQTIKELELRRRRHVSCHRCRRVVVEIHFMSKTKTRKFAPAATIARVTKWAQNHFPVDRAAASEYVLQICGTHEQPRPDVHLGELVTAECSICFNLVKEVTPQG